MTQGVLDLSEIRRSWIEENKPVVLAFCRPGARFTTDDLHPLFTREPEIPNWIGCMMRQLAYRKIIRRVGYTASQRPVSNGRAIAVWTLNES